MYVYKGQFSDVPNHSKMFSMHFRLLCLFLLHAQRFNSVGSWWYGARNLLTLNTSPFIIFEYLLVMLYMIVYTQCICPGRLCCAYISKPCAVTSASNELFSVQCPRGSFLGPLPCPHRSLADVGLRCRCISSIPFSLGCASRECVASPVQSSAAFQRRPTHS